MRLRKRTAGTSGAGWLTLSQRLMVLPIFGLPLLGLPAVVAAQEVVQQLPNPASDVLREAMRTLSRNPGSLPALLAAGRASLDLGDTEAAVGFFDRARGIAPGDGAVLAGQALVAVRQLDPLAALRLFEQARAAGENLDPYAAEHGLAYDLTGQNALAQERYGVALASGANPEVERRLALSYAIAGDQAASEATLRPLLDRRDVAAYRTRAFALAILGREEEAVSIAEVMLPPRVAIRMEPYLRRMPQLTASQQAAAANLGVFPSTVDVAGGNLERTRRVQQPARPAPSGTSDARLIPGGAPLGPTTDDLAAMDGPSTTDVRAAGATPAPPVVVATVERELPPLVRAAPPPPPARPSPPAPVIVARLEAPSPPPPPAPPAPVVVAPAEVPEPAPEPAVEVSLAEAFAAFTLPEAAPPVRATPGAVDITAFVPEREVRRPPPPPPPPPSPPPPPPHPSRHWVQVATGQDVAAFRFDWRRLVREADGALDGRQPYRARWGQTNRLVTGPFASTREAQAFVARLAEAGIDSFRFTSSAGEEVVALN